MAKIQPFKYTPIFSLLISLALSVGALGQTKIKPGMNLFSIQQDIELGRHAAQEVEQQMPMVKDSEVADYISSLGRKLARNTTMPDLPWQFKVVNSSDVNAFALPGGFVYVNRGLIEAAETEGELVGVLAHEMSHVTLRHGTNQLSKAMLAQAPLAVLGGIAGRGVVGQLAQLGIGVGANLAFMKFSRTAETQADVAGAQLMARSGYDPEEMARMFEVLEHLRKGQPGKLERWFSDHPTPENRIGRIEQEISLIRPSGDLIRNTSRFNSVRARLRSMPPAPKATPRQRVRGEGEGQGRPEVPSRNFQVYRQPQGLYSISYPSNWRVGEGGSGVLFTPPGGVEQVGDQSHIVYGALLNIFELHGSRYSSRRNTLDAAVDELVDHLIHGNPYLSEVSDRRRERLSGAEAVSVSLAGTPRGGHTEVVWLLARPYEGDIFYIAFIAPEEDLKSYEPAFREMARSLRISN